MYVMIGIMIFEANVLHWAAKLNLKSLDADNCRHYADELHGWQADLYVLRVKWLRFPDMELKEDLRGSEMVLRRLEIHFSKRVKVINEYGNNFNYAQGYAQSMGMGS